jgi:hypothetical protein
VVVGVVLLVVVIGAVVAGISVGPQGVGFLRAPQENPVLIPPPVVRPNVSDVPGENVAVGELTVPPVAPEARATTATPAPLLEPVDDIGAVWRFDFLDALRWEFELRGVPRSRYERAIQVADSFCALESNYDSDVVLGIVKGAAGEESACQFLPSTWAGLGYSPSMSTDARAVARAVADMLLAGRAREWTTWHVLGRPNVWGPAEAEAED